jgi:hypothetical protein
MSARSFLTPDEKDRHLADRAGERARVVSAPTDTELLDWLERRHGRLYFTYRAAGAPWGSIDDQSIARSYKFRSHSLRELLAWAIVEYREELP